MRVQAAGAATGGALTALPANKLPPPPSPSVLRAAEEVLLLQLGTVSAAAAPAAVAPVAAATPPPAAAAALLSVEGCLSLGSRSHRTCHTIWWLLQGGQRVSD